MTGKRVAKRGRSIQRGIPRRLVLRITLRNIDPPIWREISVPDAYSLSQLHRCIQLVFDWLDCHLFQFQVGARQFERGGSDLGGEDASATKLSELGFTAGSTALYSYDMGDGWEHDLLVVSAENDTQDDGLSLAYVLDGARAAPPEDVGGPPGYDHLLTALRRRNGGDDEDLIDWAGPDFDPERFDRRAVNHALVLASAWRAI